MAQTKKNIGIEFWLVVCLTYFLSVFLLLLFLNEFIKVGILKNVDNYHFGMSEIWYYKTASIYAITSLIGGILFLIPAIVVTLGMIKKRKLFITISFFYTIALILILLYGFDRNF